MSLSNTVLAAGHNQQTVFPLGHGAIAYLSYVGFALVMRRPLPLSWGLVPLAIGSQLPDLIDKPLAFYGLIASGRSVGHSVVTATVLLGLVTWVAHRGPPRESEPNWRARLRAVTPATLSVGYLTHLIGDAARPLLAGDIAEASFLLWPVLAPPQYAGDSVAPWVRLLAVYRQPQTHPEIGVLLAAGLVFILVRIRAHVFRRD